MVDLSLKNLFNLLMQESHLMKEFKLIVEQMCESVNKSFSSFIYGCASKVYLKGHLYRYLQILPKKEMLERKMENKIINQITKGFCPQRKVLASVWERRKKFNTNMYFST